MTTLTWWRGHRLSAAKVWMEDGYTVCDARSVATKEASLAKAGLRKHPWSNWAFHVHDVRPSSLHWSLSSGCWWSWSSKTETSSNTGSDTDDESMEFASSFRRFTSEEAAVGGGPGAPSAPPAALLVWAAVSVLLSSSSSAASSRGSSRPRLMPAWWPETTLPDDAVLVVLLLRLLLDAGEEEPSSVVLVVLWVEEDAGNGAIVPWDVFVLHESFLDFLGLKNDVIMMTAAKSLFESPRFQETTMLMQ